jgi:hypothetical protein
MTDIVIRLLHARRLQDNDCISTLIDEAADEIKRLRAERDVARREVCQLRSTSFPHDMKEVHEIADSRGWDCFKTKEREEAMDRLIQLDEELGL